MKRWLPIYLLLLIVVPALAQVSIPETAEDFKNTYGVNSSLDNIIHYALNPALRALSGGGTAGGLACDDVTDDGPNLQAALNASHGSRVYLPANASCRIKTYVSVPSHVYLVGQNTTLNFDANATHSGSQNVTMMADGTSVNPIVDVTIDGVIFNGPGTASINDRVKIVSNYAQRWKVMYSTFKNFGNTTNSTTRSTTYGHGIQFFNASDIDIHNNLVTNNVGDGISFSNNINRVRIKDNTVTLNWDSQIVPCTIGGNDIVTSGNTMITPSGLTNPPLVIDECTNTETVNNNITSVGASWCILMERVQNNSLINQDNKIIGNTCNGSNITISAAGTTQGTNSVPKGGIIKVIGNTVINSNGRGIYLSGSTNVTVTDNHIISAAAEGIAEESFGSPVGNNIISGNTVDGAQRCLRSLNSGGTVLASVWTNNKVKNCSVSPMELVVPNAGNSSTNVFDIVADSTTDVSSTVNNVLANTGYLELNPTKGMEYYYAASTIVVPAGATLSGRNAASSMGLSFTGVSTYGSTGGVKIKCAATVSPCVQVGQNVQGGKSTSLNNVYVGRVGSLPAAGTGYIGIQWMGGYNSRGFNVSSDNHAICFAWKTPAGTNDGLSFMGNQLYGYSCSDAYLWQDEWPETRLTNSRFGDTNGTAANTYIRISCSRHDCTGAAASNGLELVNSQFNSGGPPVGKLIELKDFGSAVEGASGQDAELPTMASVHAENFNVFMTSDSSVDVARGMKLTNSSFYVNTDTFQLDPTTSVDKWEITGTEFLDATGAMTFNLNPSGNSTYNATKRTITHLQMAGGMIGGTGHITGQGATNSMASFVGVSHGNTFTLDGRWANLSVIGGNWSGGNLVDNTNAADDVTIMENNIFKFHGNVGVTCGAGISATTGRTYKGLITAC